eukprot:11707905-Karenia_brevis.AAC.1
MFRSTLADEQVNRLTFSEVVAASESFAAGLWLWQYQPPTSAASSGSGASSSKGPSSPSKNNK